MNARVRATEGSVRDDRRVRRRCRGQVVGIDPRREDEEQAEQTALLPILTEPIALMADAHLGYGATIGSVIPTESAVIPQRLAPIKPIDAVMRDQADLVEIEVELSSIANYKGVERT
jgi:hypothetical protein